MKNALKGLLAAAMLMTLGTAAARADRTEATSFGIGLSSGTVVFDHVIGIGGDFSIPFGGGRHAFTVDGRYEFGNYKEEDNAPPPTEYEFNASGYRVRLGIDHQMAIGDRGMLYFGPGVSYASHKFTTKSTGNPDDESEPYNVWGIAARLGASMAASESIEAFAQAEQTFGWGSAEDGTDKLTQTDVMTSFRFGLRFVFATQQ